MRDLASFTDCSAVLGASAPDPRTVVQAMDEALQWRALRERTEQWDAYVRSQDGAAWQTAFTLLDDLKARFVLAAKSEPMLKVQYPALAAMFDAPKEKAQRSAATRKKRQKAADAEEAAKAAAKTGETPPAPPPTVQVQVT